MIFRAINSLHWYLNRAWPFSEDGSILVCRERPNSIPNSRPSSVDSEKGSRYIQTMTTKTLNLSVSSTKSRVLWISIFTILTGLSGWIKIPLGFTPVPITLQTGVVLLSGIVLGRDGMWSQLAYLVLGGIGLPFFASNLPGVQVLFGATGGYLIGFVAAAAFVGRFVQPHWNSIPYWKRNVWLLASSLLVFVPGVIQLWLITGLSFSKVLVLGFYPFILGDILKVLAVSATPTSWIVHTHSEK